jgi:molybdopterin converting factor small subunit
MKGNSTEQKLIKIIAEHYLNSGMGKLTISSVSEKAGISRQSFNSYYKHLKPYVLGKKQIGELLREGDGENNNLLVIVQKKISELQNELQQIQEKHTKELEDVKARYITSLMNNDITLKETDEVRLTLEKQALHNEQLLNQKKSLEQELMLLKARSYNLQSSGENSSNDGGEVILVDPDLSSVFSNYEKTKDVDVFEDEKEAVLDRILKRINKFCIADGAEVIIYIERYISNFDKFSKSYQATGNGTRILVRLPIFTRTELQIFISKITPIRPVTVYVPYCDSEAVIKAQHKFIFRDVPDYEIQAADKHVMPSIKDGFEKLVIFRVNQGD